MDISIRTDSSHEIGSGHVIRCITLARELTNNGHNCKFICRDLKGNLNSMIANEFKIDILPKPFNSSRKNISNYRNEHWAGVDWLTDARQTKSKINRNDWLICDHYSFDYRWEETLCMKTKKLMVIDDLANRKHCCNLLLDATLGRDFRDYNNLVDENTKLLIGAEYALLRPEFKNLREKSLSIRKNRELENILICIGGMDEQNFIPKIIKSLEKSFNTKIYKVNILISSNSPNLDNIKNCLKNINFPVKLLLDKKNIGEIMVETDLAISAGGLLSYELVTMGVPMIIFPVSEIQRKMALIFKHLSNSMEIFDPFSKEDFEDLNYKFLNLTKNIKSKAISNVNFIPEFDGGGCKKVAKVLEET